MTSWARNLVPGRKCQTSSARPSTNIKLAPPANFQTVGFDMGTDSNTNPTKLIQIGTPPKKHGVPLCQRSERGLETHPCARQIRTVNATSPAVNRNARTNVPACARAGPEECNIVAIDWLQLETIPVWQAYFEVVPVVWTCSLPLPQLPCGDFWLAQS